MAICNDNRIRNKKKNQWHFLNFKNIFLQISLEIIYDCDDGSNLWTVKTSNWSTSTFEQNLDLSRSWGPRRIHKGNRPREACDLRDIDTASRREGKSGAKHHRPSGLVVESLLYEAELDVRPPPPRLNYLAGDQCSSTDKAMKEHGWDRPTSRS